MLLYMCVQRPRGSRRDRNEAGGVQTSHFQKRAGRSARKAPRYRSPPPRLLPSNPTPVPRGLLSFKKGLVLGVQLTCVLLIEYMSLLEVANARLCSHTLVNDVCAGRGAHQACRGDVRALLRLS